MSLSKRYAVIVAGGKGLRMNSDLPKQFMELKGIPVLMHTVNAFFLVDSSIEIILVLPKEHHEYWRLLVEKYDFKVPHTTVSGGASRFQSVKNGLSTINGTGLVAIHDGVRPLISTDVIENAYQIAAKSTSAITVVASKDSIREITEDGTKSVDRNKYYLVQTPQTFDVQALKRAYHAEEKAYFTDDASVFEDSGGKVSLVSGDYKNIKITTPEDLVIAACFIEFQK
ncbi:MAG: 2-C-methyl-D-erythritol 4-phosphate cytidylyltransferase [Bacteroidota bacterium]